RAKRSGLKSNLGTQKPEPIRVPVSFSAFKFQLNNYSSALITSKKALNEHVNIGNYDGIKASREMIINCYMKLNMKDKAKAEAQLILDKSFEKENIESKN
ncbi:hypothetical protein, partial [Lactobacillus helveticus]|uniref:hypothetical protein n=1 Tax=Lactobacillus helveticus TaxID=1587 RepID=UPI00187B4356